MSTRKSILAPHRVNHACPIIERTSLHNFVDPIPGSIPRQSHNTTGSCYTRRAISHAATHGTNDLCGDLT